MDFNAMPFVALLFLAVSANAESRYVLEDALADDQTSERVELELDGKVVAKITLSSASPRQEILLPLTAPVHRYRLRGETMTGGTRYTIEGAGLIVSTPRMDEIGEAETASAALDSYEALAAEIVKAAPGADLQWIALQRDEPVTMKEISAAEERLKTKLPVQYVRFVTTTGAFRLKMDGLFGPDAVAPAADHAVNVVRENGWDDPDDLEQMKRRIEKRYPKAKRDIVFGTFELGEPVLFTSEKCGKDEVAMLLPGSDFDLLGNYPGDNVFMQLIDYEDDIMGERQCVTFDQMIAYSLHDHLIEMADEALYKRDTESEKIGFYRARVDEETKTIWMRFTDAD